MILFSGLSNNLPVTSLKIKLSGRILLGHQGPTRRDIPDPGPGMSRPQIFLQASVLLFYAGNGRDVPRFGRIALWRAAGHCPASLTSRDQNNFLQETLGFFCSYKVARLQNEVGTNDFSESHEFSYEKQSEIIPSFLGPFVGPTKSQQSSLQISHKISLQEIKNTSPTSFLRCAGRTGGLLRKMGERKTSRLTPLPNVVLDPPSSSAVRFCPLSLWYRFSVFPCKHQRINVKASKPPPKPPCLQTTFFWASNILEWCSSAMASGNEITCF